jgi:hypothetical protein
MNKQAFIKQYKELNNSASTKQAEEAYKARKNTTNTNSAVDYNIVKLPAEYTPLPAPKSIIEQTPLPHPEQSVQPVEQVQQPPLEPEIDTEAQRKKILEKIADIWTTGLHRCNYKNQPHPLFPQHPIYGHDTTITDILYIVRKLYKNDISVSPLLAFLTTSPKMILDWSKTQNHLPIVSLWKQNGLIFDETTGWSSMIILPINMDYLEETINEFKHSHPKTIELDEIELDEIQESPLMNVKTKEQLIALLVKTPDALQSITDANLEFYGLSQNEIQELRRICAIEDTKDRTKMLKNFGVEPVVEQQTGGSLEIVDDSVDTTLIISLI